jgi:hypothetical protein
VAAVDALIEAEAVVSDADVEIESLVDADPDEDIPPAPLADAEAIVEMADEDEALEEVADELELSAEDETDYPGVDDSVPATED